MNIYKFESQYFSKGLAYASEVFIPGNLRIESVLEERMLPEEELTSESMMCVHNHDWYPEFELHKESVAHYIWEKQYVDAVHRLMYLSLIVGVDNVDIGAWFQDDGLMHQLVHLKTGYNTVNISQLVDRANKFESMIPGTFIWAQEQIRT